MGFLKEKLTVNDRLDSIELGQFVPLGPLCTGVVRAGRDEGVELTAETVEVKCEGRDSQAVLIKGTADGNVKVEMYVVQTNLGSKHYFTAYWKGLVTFKENFGQNMLQGEGFFKGLIRDHLQNSKDAKFARAYELIDMIMDPVLPNAVGYALNGGGGQTGGSGGGQTGGSGGGQTGGGRKGKDGGQTGGRKGNGGGQTDGGQTGGGSDDEEPGFHYGKDGFYDGITKDGRHFSYEIRNGEIVNTAIEGGETGGGDGGQTGGDGGQTGGDGSGQPGGGGRKGNGGGKTKETTKPAEKHDTLLNQLVFLTREEAANGCSKTIETADGRTIKVNIPAGVQSNTHVDVDGQGRVDPATGKRGVLRLSFSVM